MNEIMQFCVQWKHPENESVLTAAIAALDDGTCEVIGVDTGKDYVMRKIAVHAADCEDGSITVNGKAILPELYCTKWRGVLKKPFTPAELVGKYIIVCNVVRSEGSYLGYLEELAKTFGCEMPQADGEFIRINMLAPETQTLMFQNYASQSAINNSDQWSAWKMEKVGHDLFSMREAERAGMEAENVHRLSVGQSIAYGDEAFQALHDRYASTIGSNAIMEMVHANF